MRIVAEVLSLPLEQWHAQPESISTGGKKATKAAPTKPGSHDDFLSKLKKVWSEAQDNIQRPPLRPFAVVPKKDWIAHTKESENGKECSKEEWTLPLGVPVEEGMGVADLSAWEANAIDTLRVSVHPAKPSQMCAAALKL